MKLCITLFLLISSRFLYGQVMHQTVREDKTFEYWFSLDQYQKPLNYAIEISHLGGNFNRLTGKMSGGNRTGLVSIQDLNGNVLFEKTLGSDLSFEFTTEHKEVVIEFTVDGYVTYSKKTGIETLSMLVLKLQPEPQDEIYQINSVNELSETELESIMKCVNDCQEQRQSNFNTCGKQGEIRISLQI